jgi:hypothetical protein
VYSILVRKPDGKRPLERPKPGWENNIKVDLKDIVWEGVYWIRIWASGWISRTQ